MVRLRTFDNDYAIVSKSSLDCLLKSNVLKIPEEMYEI